MKTVFNAITIGPISIGLNGTPQVELRQTIDRLYDDSSDLSDALFAGTRASYTETRVDWKSIPEGATEEVVKLQLSSFPEARLRKFLSHNVIISDAQKNVIDNGFQGANGEKAFADFKAKQNVKSTTWDAACKAAFIAMIADSQLVRYGEGNTAGKPADEAILYNGKKQYKVVAFVTSALPDVDARQELATAQSEVIDLVSTGVEAKEGVTA